MIYEGAHPQPSGDRMCYWVSSDRNPRNKYRVDLLANNGAGGCSCADFRTRRQPAIDRGEPTWTETTTCKHTIKTARYFLRTLFRDMARSESTPPRR